MYTSHICMLLLYIHHSQITYQLLFPGLLSCHTRHLSQAELDSLLVGGPPELLPMKEKYWENHFNSSRFSMADLSQSHPSHLLLLSFLPFSFNPLNFFMTQNILPIAAVCRYQCSSQRQLQRAMLSQRSKHSCGLITFFQPHQKKIVYLRAVEHHSSAL